MHRSRDLTTGASNGAELLRICQSCTRPTSMDRTLPYPLGMRHSKERSEADRPAKEGM